MSPHIDRWRTRWFAPWLRRIDAFFFARALRESSAGELAHARMGIVLSAFSAVATLLVLPTQIGTWPATSLGIAASVAVATLVLPFLVRQRNAIRYVGQAACAALAANACLSLWMSGGQGGGLLPLLTILPVFGLIVGGAESALFWMGIGLVICGSGALLVAQGAPSAPGYVEPSLLDRYAIAGLALVGIGVITQLFDAFWNRAAIQVAERAQADLREKEERNRRLLEHASEGVMIVDPAGVVKFASPAAERLLGVSPGDAKGRRLRDFTLRDDYLEHHQKWPALVRDVNRVFEIQIRARPGLVHDPDAETRVLDLVISNQLANPAVEGMVVRLRDMTDLARAEASYRSLIDHSTEGIAVESEGEIVYANDALGRLFQTTREQILEEGELDGNGRVHPDHRARLESASDGPETGAFEIRFEAAPGAWRWLRMRWGPASWRSRPARQIAFTDITLEKEQAARKEREHERLAAAIQDRTRELEASQLQLREKERMASIGTLAAGIAHQINNPVGAILTTADYAILTADEEESDRIRTQALEEIRSQAIRCGKIVRSVLQFSRSEPTEKWSSDVTTVLRTAVDVTARYASDRGAIVEVDLDASMADRRAPMNPIEIEQVFVNLIRNAIETRPRGARVRVSARLNPDEQIEVVIADDGPGIRQRDATHVFDPFYTTRLEDGGTGLGLSVAHGIVVDHGGAMWVESGPDSRIDGYEGAHFHVLLPSDESRQRRSRPAVRRAPSSAPPA